MRITLVAISIVVLGSIYGIAYIVQTASTVDIFGHKASVEIAKIEANNEQAITEIQTQKDIEVANINANVQKHISNNTRATEQYKTSVVPLNLIIIMLGLIIITIIIKIGKEILCIVT